MAIEVDVLEFIEWKRHRSDDDMLHAFKSIKCLERIAFLTVTEASAEKFAELVSEIIEEWK
jgi:hypothetical protein